MSRARSLSVIGCVFREEGVCSGVTVVTHTMLMRHEKPGMLNVDAAQNNMGWNKGLNSQRGAGKLARRISNPREQTAHRKLFFDASPRACVCVCV